MISFIAAAALRLSPVGSFLKRVPKPVWIALAVAAVIALGAFMHGRAVKHAYAAAYAQGKADEGARIEAKARKLEAGAIAIAETLRSQNHVENRRIAGAADAIRLSGPGKAACLNPATPGASGRIAPSGSGAATVDQLPDAERIDLIAVPFARAVAGAEQADLNRAEVLTWREWHRKLTEEWQKDQR